MSEPAQASHPSNALDIITIGPGATDIPGIDDANSSTNQLQEI
jgi:hypothetical protein